MANPVQGVIPHLVVNDATAALEFYRTALGATEMMRVPAEDGKRILHAEIAVNGARIYLRDDFPEVGGDQCDSTVAPPSTLGKTTVALHLDVENCNEAVKCAEGAGAKVVMPPWDAFWGARYAQIVDPFGHAWSFAHPLPGHEG